MMTPRVERLRERFFDNRPAMTAERQVLATEAYKKYAGEAIPILRARVLEYVLDHQTIFIWDDELIVGNLTNKFRGGIFHLEYESTSWLREEIDDFPVRTADPYDVSPEDREEMFRQFDFWDGKAIEDLAEEFLPEDIRTAISDGVITVGGRGFPSSHTVPNYERLLKEGLNGYIARCEQKIAETKGGTKEKQEKIDFWQGCIIICKAVIRFANRYADLAEEKAKAETDANRKKELLRIAENLRNSPANPARNYYEAMQAIFLMHLVLHIECNTAGCGFGRVDVYMYPYLKKDIEEGIMTREEAKEILGCFYLKIGEYFCLSDHWYAVSFAGYPMWQILMIGGQDENGNDVTNDMTYIVLEVGRDLRLTQPPIAMRYHDGTPEKLMNYATTMIQEGLANPALFNDKAMIPIVKAKGGTDEEAMNWIIIGCVEPHEGGYGTDGSPTGGYMNGLKCLELALHNGKDPITGDQLGPETGDATKFTTKEELIEAVKTQLIYFWDKIHEGYSIVVPNHMLRLPVMYGSILVDGCIDKGMSVQQGGAFHNHVGTFFCGAANVGDSIAAIDEFVFKQKKLTMEELLDILKSDFEGNEPVRQMLLNGAPKFGNNNKDVDDIVREIVNHCAEHVQEYEDIRGGTWCLSNLSQTVNISHGEKVGATPDGRKAFQPLSDNASPAMGRDVSGPTATINSLSSLEQTKNYDGTLFNLRFDPRGVSGEEGRKIIEGTIKTYFEDMGCHIQINVIDSETLRKAQKEPEKYKDIVVRVAGYMAYFTDLDKVAQDTLIERTAHLA